MVIKCSRICNKHKYFVSVVVKVMNANVGKILLLVLFVFIGDGCWHPDSILTLTVFQSRQFFTLARPYIKYMLYSLQIFRHISCMVSVLTI